MAGECGIGLAALLFGVLREPGAKVDRKNEECLQNIDIDNLDVLLGFLLIHFRVLYPMDNV